MRRNGFQLAARICVEDMFYNKMYLYVDMNGNELAYHVNSACGISLALSHVVSDDGSLPCFVKPKWLDAVKAALLLRKNQKIVSVEVPERKMSDETTVPCSKAVLDKLREIVGNVDYNSNYRCRWCGTELIDKPPSTEVRSHCHNVFCKVHDLRALICRIQADTARYNNWVSQDAGHAPCSTQHISVTPMYFHAKVGRHAENDELDRCNCKEAGTPGHQSCGWCHVHDRPVFNCGCMIKHDNLQNVPKQTVAPI